MPSTFAAVKAAFISIKNDAPIIGREFVVSRLPQGDLKLDFVLAARNVLQYHFSANEKKRRNIVGFQMYQGEQYKIDFYFAAGEKFLFSLGDIVGTRHRSTILKQASASFIENAKEYMINMGIIHAALVWPWGIKSDQIIKAKTPHIVLLREGVGIIHPKLGQVYFPEINEASADWRRRHAEKFKAELVPA